MSWERRDWVAAMSEVFYRKWRPRRFDQVIGQVAVTQTLRNAVTLGRVAHAYLFCGPRGTGKTSTARVLAKAANCLSPQDGEPDNECEICVSINEARALDLIEIDAASNRGIDDIRNLRDKIHFVPNEARYKVYIVDEVHMLTEPAFNALLKTLEEPPDHVIFVLATTEAHKVPLTIISRCQRFDFRRIPLETATTRLTELCSAEGIEAAPEVLMLIARASAGSLRDAENLLEQAFVSYGSPLREDQVRDLLELGSDKRALELVGHVISRSAQDGLTVINEVAAEGTDLRQFHRGVMEHLRGILLLKSGADASLGYPEETTSQIRALAQKVALEQIVRALKTFAKVEVRRDSPSPLPLELALVESTLNADVSTTPAQKASATGPEDAPSPRRDRPQPAQDISPPAAGPEDAPSPRRDSPQPAQDISPPAAGPAPMRTSAQSTDSIPSEPTPRLENKWNEILKSLSRYKGKRFNLGALLRDCREREVGDGLITLKFSYRSHMERMEQELDDPQTRKVLQETLEKALDGPYKIQVSLVDGQVSGPQQSASRRSHLVRVAQAMGAKVVGEKEEERESEDDPAGPGAPEADAEDAGGA